MRFKIEQRASITREYVREHPDKIFLFGDNLLRVGYGGQARAMRGEPNAIGIPTKKKPSYTEDSFFSDIEFEQNKAAIDQAFSELLRRKKASVIVFSTFGLGTGRAELRDRAPKTFEYLEERLAELGHLD